MSCSYHNFIFRHSHRHLAISILILVISSSSNFRLIFNAQGRTLAQTTGFSSTTVKEKKTMWRAQIGSRPPSCEPRCGSCTHCEAIQVPTTNKPQIKLSRIENSKGDDNDYSNYKPMSWKCKCGNLIFNP